MSQSNNPAATAPSAVDIDPTTLQALIQALTATVFNGLIAFTTTMK